MNRGDLRMQSSSDQFDPVMAEAETRALIGELGLDDEREARIVRDAGGTAPDLIVLPGVCRY
jgi:hypothetical protein